MIYNLSDHLEDMYHYNRSDIYLIIMIYLLNSYIQLWAYDDV